MTYCWVLVYKLDGDVGAYVVVAVVLWCCMYHSLIMTVMVRVVMVEVDGK